MHYVSHKVLQKIKKLCAEKGFKLQIVASYYHANMQVFHRIQIIK